MAVFAYEEKCSGSSSTRFTVNATKLRRLLLPASLQLLLWESTLTSWQSRVSVPTGGTAQDHGHTRPWIFEANPAAWSSGTMGLRPGQY